MQHETLDRDLLYESVHVLNATAVSMQKWHDAEFYIMFYNKKEDRSRCCKNHLALGTWGGNGKSEVGDHS